MFTTKTLPPGSVEIKSFFHQTIRVALTDLSAKRVRAQLAQVTSPQDEFFDWQPVVIDLTYLPANQSLVSANWRAILSVFKDFRLNPVAVVGADESFKPLSDPLRLGMLKAEDLVPTKQKKERPEPVPETHSDSTEKIADAELMTRLPAMQVDHPVRSGVRVYAKDRDLIVTGSVSNGAEIISDGNLYVYGALMGRAVAGASGNRDAKIFARDLKAELVSIGGVYRTFESSELKAFLGCMVQICLNDKDGSSKIEVEKIV